VPKFCVRIFGMRVKRCSGWILIWNSTTCQHFHIQVLRNCYFVDHLDSDQIVQGSRLNGVRDRQSFQCWAISQRKGFRFRDLLEAMSPDVRHPKRASKFIKDATDDHWLFQERLGRGRMLLDEDLQGTERSEIKKKQRFWLSHPRYFTRGWNRERVDKYVSKALAHLVKDVLTHHRRIIQAKVIRDCYVQIVRAITIPLTNSIGINFWNELRGNRS